MNLTMIEASDNLMLDANIILYAIQQKSLQCTELINRISSGEINCFISTHVLAEVMHVLMIEEARKLGSITSGNPARKLSENPGIVRSLSQYEILFEDLLNIGLNIVEVTKSDLLDSLNIQRQYGLLTNDSLIIAVTKRLGVTKLVSADNTFSRLRNITLYSPDDILTT
ncbi:hypothetical protein MASR1M107_24020 [Ignavibacteriales bacterium]